MTVAHLEELVNQGRHVEAWAHFGRLILDPNLSDQDLGLAHLSIAVSRYLIGQFHSAKSLGGLAEEYATRAGDAVLLGKVWANLAEFCRVVNDQALAHAYVSKWFDNLPMCPELEGWRGRMTYTLALILRSRRESGYLTKLREAIQFMRREFETAIPERKAVTGDHLRKALQMAARTCYELRTVQEGDQHHADAETVIKQMGSPQDAVREQLAVQMCKAYFTGDFAGAIALAQEFLAEGSPSTKDQQFWACWYSAMVYARNPETLRIAKSIGATVLDLSLDLKTPQYMNLYSELNKAIAETERRVG